MIVDIYSVSWMLNRNAGEYGGGMAVVVAQNHDDAQAQVSEQLHDLADTDVLFTSTKLLVTSVGNLNRGIIIVLYCVN